VLVARVTRVARVARATALRIGAALSSRSTRGVDTAIRKADQRAVARTVPVAGTALVTLRTRRLLLVGATRARHEEPDQARTHPRKPVPRTHHGSHLSSRKHDDNT